MRPIYLDTAAATPLDPRVGRVIRATEQKLWANPSSLHTSGVAASAALAAARASVAESLGAQAEEIIFTSGGTEANNLAVFGAPAGEIIVSAVEHASVLSPAAARGRVLILPVDEQGQVKLAGLKKLLSPATSLVSIIYAHNEIGVIQDIKAVAKIIRQHRAQFKTPLPYLHIDACQAPRFLNLNVHQLGVDLMTINASKIYGPKGVGALFIKRGVNLKPRVYGGGQERDYRAGSENVPAISGLAAALKLAVKDHETQSKKLTVLRDYALKKILQTIPNTVVNGHLLSRLPNNLNLSFAGVLGEQVVLELSAVGVAASTGSACSIPKHDDSYVILALGKSAELAKSAVRFTLSRDTTTADINYLVKHLKKIITKLRTANYVYAANLAL